MLKGRNEDLIKMERDFLNIDAVQLLAATIPGEVHPMERSFDNLMDGIRDELFDLFYKGEVL